MDAPQLVLKPDTRRRLSPLERLLLLVSGFGVGFVLALTFAWNITTPGKIEGSIASLRSQDKERYVVLVSMSYALNGDLETTQRRLSQLNDRDIRRTVRSLAERYTNDLRPVSQRSSLAKLAVALGADSDAASQPHIAKFIHDADGNGLLGVKVRIRWSDGCDGGTSQPAFGLSSDGLDSDCSNDGREHFRAWRVVSAR